MSKAFVGIDVSKEWIDLCKKKYQKVINLDFKLANGERLGFWENKHFDVVIMNMVLLNVPTKSKVSKMVSEASKVIKKSGAFVFSDLHPLSKITDKYRSRKTERGNGFSYFKNGSSFTAVVKAGKQQQIRFRNRHWNIEFYSGLLKKNNFHIERIVESQFSKNTPASFQREELPEYIIFFCRKCG